MITPVSIMIATMITGPKTMPYQSADEPSHQLYIIERSSDSEANDRAAKASRALIQIKSLVGALVVLVLGRAYRLPPDAVSLRVKTPLCLRALAV